MHVVNVFFGVQMERFVGTAVDLPPASHALRHGKAFALPGFVLVHQPGQLGARPHQAHVADQDVEQLGQFVQAGAA